METVSRYMVQHAQQLAHEVSARAVMVYADAIQRDGELRHLLQAIDFPAILVTRSKELHIPPGFESHTWITVPAVPMTRAGQVKTALLVALARGLIRSGDRVVCLTGLDASQSIDTLLVLNLGSEPELFSLFDPSMFTSSVVPGVFERVLTLATQLAVEGREGRPVGVLFVLGDSERVLAQSRSLVLNPFRGHPESECNILDPALEETIKEFSALDGAFVVRGDGTVLTAGTLLVPTGKPVQLPGGLGTRHAAAAGISASTNALAVCVSQSTGTVAVFKSGRMVTEIHRSTNGGSLPV
jgi:DNA integrity scanning protein DisA with diadenylate cyclase activity